MTRSSGFKVGMGIAVAALAGIQQAAAQAPTLSVDPSRLPRLGTIDARFQSYNLEMVEVTGGRFWKPYKASASAPSDRGADNAGNIPAGGNPDLYAYREPIDLSNPRLRTLAAALAPAYMRVSGTWANTTYFAESDDAPSTPPNGFRAVLSRERWKGCHRLCPRRQRRDHDLDGNKPRCPGRSRSVAERSGASLLCLHQIRRRQNCRCRVHERADAGRHGRCTKRLRRGSLRAGLQGLCCVHQGERTGCDRSGARFDRRDGRSRNPAPNSSLRGICLRHPAPASTRFPIITTARSRNDAPEFRVRPRPRPRFRKRGWRARAGRSRSTNRSGTSLRLISRCG